MRAPSSTHRTACQVRGYDANAQERPLGRVLGLLFFLQDESRTPGSGRLCYNAQFLVLHYSVLSPFLFCNVAGRPPLGEFKLHLFQTKMAAQCRAPNQPRFLQTSHRHALFPASAPVLLLNCSCWEQEGVHPCADYGYFRIELPWRKGCTTAAPCASCGCTTTRSPRRPDWNRSSTCR